MWKRLAAVLLVGEARFGEGKGVAADDAGNLAALGGGALEEFEACRCVVEEILDGDHATARRGLALLFAPGTTFDAHERAQFVIDVSGDGCELTDGGDGGQRFAAEAERAQFGEVLRGAQFAGGVPREGQADLRRADAMAIIAHADALGATATDFDVNAARAGIERILDELLDDRSRPLDDLTCRDLVDH